MPNSAAAMLVAATPKKRRRVKLIASGTLIVFIGEFSIFGSVWFGDLQAPHDVVSGTAKPAM
jgi:hypothetical protein